MLVEPQSVPLPHGTRGKILIHFSRLPLAARDSYRTITRCTGDRPLSL